MEDYWVTIPEGEFQMGSESGDSNEQHVHTVFLDEYRIGKYEVTNKQYNQCLRAAKCTGSVVPDKLDDPVVNVNWHAAKTYCEWVDGRLPTEAEWEKAASWNAETKTKSVYPWGDHIDCSFANYVGRDNESASCVGDTAPVGSYQSGKSPYGLYDMAGNVWEWVNDWYDENYYQYSPSSNPSGPESAQFREVRGGSWGDYAYTVRSAYRRAADPLYSSFGVGFRCAR
jgi:formylglycine-generating enzyme required for sulfatase activity